MLHELKQLATRASTMCPALIFAISRTVKVSGRIITLIVSIKIKNGVRIVGVPLGKKWAKNFLGLKLIPLRIRYPHKDSANPDENHSDLLKPKVNGVKPNKLMKAMKKISAPGNPLFVLMTLLEYKDNAEFKLYKCDFVDKKIHTSKGVIQI